jgi:hypothetical protein
MVAKLRERIEGWVVRAWSKASRDAGGETHPCMVVFRDVHGELYVAFPVASQEKCEEIARLAFERVRVGGGSPF